MKHQNLAVISCVAALVAAAPARASDYIGAEPPAIAQIMGTMNVMAASCAHGGEVYEVLGFATGAEGNGAIHYYYRMTDGSLFRSNRARLLRLSTDRWVLSCTESGDAWLPVAAAG